MKSTPQSRLDLLVKLIEIPSVTESPKENMAGNFIFDHLSSLPYFKKNPQHIELYSTPLERDERPLHTVIARVMAKKATKRTILLVGHFDVVEVSMYGELRKLAFSPYKLQEELLKTPEVMSKQGLADLKSGHFLFGRGSMDMKCGLTLGLELLRDFATNQDMFDVNIMIIAVPDEENSSAGMRGALKKLVQLQKKEGLDFICTINTEPSEPGRPGATNQIVFTGTVGKISPVFFCVGQESHVGNYYQGLSAPLMAANVIRLAEANPELADPAGENTCPSWICLGMEILREGYSVTIPNRAVSYFNCFSVHKTPAQIMQEIKKIATQAVTLSLEQVRSSSSALLEMGYANGAPPHWEVPVITIEELSASAIKRLGGHEELHLKVQQAIVKSDKTDLRDLAIVALQEIHLNSGHSAPMLVVGFLPPYYPARNNQVNDPKFRAVGKAVDALIAEAKTTHGLNIDECTLFAGICDLSYMGFQGNPEDLLTFHRNLADQGALYTFPTEELTSLNIPIINLGPCGYDAHKLEERLELTYSLNTLPKLIEHFILTLEKH